jgi:hypothetical protein
LEPASVPLTVTVFEAIAAVAAGLKVNVEDCPASTGLGLKAAVVPDGTPEAVS